MYGHLRGLKALVDSLTPVRPDVGEGFDPSTCPVKIFSQFHSICAYLSSTVCLLHQCSGGGEGLGLGRRATGTTLGETRVSIMFSEEKKKKPALVFG